MIAFDIDDTINDIFLNKIESKVPVIKVKMPDDAKDFFERLKSTLSQNLCKPLK